MITRILVATAMLAGCTSMAPTGSTTFSLDDSKWELVAIQSMDDAEGTTQFDGPKLYSISFAAGGRASLRIDCIHGAATWKAMALAEPSSGTMEFGAFATTKAFCPPGSHERKVLRDLPYVRSYLLKDGKLYLFLMADGGVYEWRPALH